MTDSTAENITNFPRRAEPGRLAENAASIRDDVRFYKAPAGHTIDNLLTPPYWSRVASKLKPLCRVEVVDDEMTYFAEFIVLRVDTDGVHLAPLRGVELHGTGARDAMPRDKTGIRAAYRGVHLRWCAMRGEVVLRDKFPTERDALQWITSHQKAQS